MLYYHPIVKYHTKDIRWGRGFNPVQSMYSTALADWAIVKFYLESYARRLFKKKKKKKKKRKSSVDISEAVKCI